MRGMALRCKDMNAAFYAAMVDHVDPLLTGCWGRRAQNDLDFAYQMGGEL